MAGDGYGGWWLMVDGGGWWMEGGGTVYKSPLLININILTLRPHTSFVAS